MTTEVSLRDVKESDLPIFYAQQVDPEATRMAAFPSRDREAFMAHWRKTMTDKSVIAQTVMFDGRVAGNILCWEDSNERHVGYWFGKEFWGKGIASAALSRFLDRLTTRPLVARVAKFWLASWAWRDIEQARVRQYLFFWICGILVFVGFALLLWPALRSTVPADSHQLRSLLLLVALLAIPFARLGLAPRSLAGNRHRS